MSEGSHVTAGGFSLRHAMSALKIMIVSLGTFLSAAPAQAVSEAEAADKPAVNISVFVSSREDVCFDPGDVGAIKALTLKARDRVNSFGGIAGHKLDLTFLDDKRDKDKAIANMQEALAAPNAVAMIGLSSSERAKAVFQATGTEIQTKKIPFFSAISVNSIFADFENVYTTRASQDDERIPVLVQFSKRNGVKRPAFVGIKDAVFSNSLVDGLKADLDATPLVADHRLTLTDDKLDPNEVADVVANLKQQAPDLIFLTTGSNKNAAIIKELLAAGITPRLMLSGRIDSLPPEIASAYPSAMYELAWDRLPELYSDRLLDRLALAPPSDWVFEGQKIASAPGWVSGECKPRPEGTADPLSSDNLRAIGIGTQYADIVALIAAASRTAPQDVSLADLRAHILDQLKTSFAAGRGAFQGAYENWSFEPKSRTATRTPFIVQLAPGAKRTQLAPLQFAKLRNNKLQPVNTIYLDVDLIRVPLVLDNDKSFFAEFYLSMRDEGKGASIDQIEFANALLNPQTNDRQLNVRLLNDGGKSDAFPDDVKIYHVSGRFMFAPDLESFPFDTQKFAIELRPKQSNTSFIIQPPPSALRDQAVAVDGWEPVKNYVSYDQQYIGTVDAKVHEQSVVPFYKTSFVWLMTRQTTDYYLRVVVPLMFILIVAYMSIFIPLTHFEAIVTIQVTALLSAVALYLSLPAIDADTTTLSDRLFLFNYMAVSLMIGISIARVNDLVTDRPGWKFALGLFHVVAIPVGMLLVALYIRSASGSAI